MSSIWKLGIAQPPLNYPDHRLSYSLFENDTVLGSYPRSGNTWLRLLLTSGLKGADTNPFEDVESLFPDIHKYSNKELLKFLRPRTLKSHYRCNLSVRRAIYVVRDPRKVFLSVFRFCRSAQLIDPNLTLENYLPVFLEGGPFDYGNWEEHVKSYLTVACLMTN